MQIVLTLLGVAVVVLGLRDMYHSLLHPSGSGSLSHTVMTGVWKLSRATGHRFGAAVGPAAMGSAVLLWVALQALGWALVYLPHVPGGFTYSPGVDPARYGDFAEALYVSLVTLATLGFGDVVATDAWVRLAAPLEALTGFALLTAALTWFTQIYPPLSRRRSLALELKGLADTGWADRLPRLDPVAAAGVLHPLATQIGRARIDFTQHSETYFFQEQDPDLSLAAQLPAALALRDAAADSPAPEVAAAAEVLDRSLDQLGAKLGEFVGGGEDPEAVFAAYARDHGRAFRR
ncbi:potassium channel family protein [Kocuria flava]|uniref:potassium channel family protein n=1 Tax=Kocuria flava TaxID=446860 RepID=UPI003F1DF343